MMAVLETMFAKTVDMFSQKGELINISCWYIATWAMVVVSHIMFFPCFFLLSYRPKAWADLPDNYSCPPCGAPKRRFKKVPKGSASGKVEVKKSWF